MIRLNSKYHITKSGKVSKKREYKEASLQNWAADFFKRVLIPGVAKYEGHESSIGLGFMPAKPLDTMITKACKNFYNRFVMAAQRKFQAKGVSKGSSDGFLFYKGGVVCLEFKVDKNKPQDAQKEFAADMALLGYPTENPRTQKEIIEITKKYNIRIKQDAECNNITAVI